MESPWRDLRGSTCLFKGTGGEAWRGEARRRQRSLMQLIPTQKNEVARFNRGVLCVFPTSSDPTSSLLLLHTPSPHPPLPEAHCGVYLMADDFPFARRLHSARSAPGPQREEGGAPSLN